MLPTSFTRATAEAEAEDLLGSEWEGKGLPVNPIEIAKSLGLKVVETNLDDGIDGVIIKERDTDGVIVVSSSIAEVRKRFTIAHEIGHYILELLKHPYGDLDKFEIVEYRDGRSSQGIYADEVFANQFGAALLMPAALVRAMMTDNESRILAAHKFGVSLEAFENRLITLGLI